jgi:hypothetical protein
VSEMNTGIQQFLNANTNHNIFLWLKARPKTNHPAEHGIVYNVVVAAQALQPGTIMAVFPSSMPAIEASAPRRVGEPSRPRQARNCFSHGFFSDLRSPGAAKYL